MVVVTRNLTILLLFPFALSAFNVISSILVQERRLKQTVSTSGILDDAVAEELEQHLTQQPTDTTQPQLVPQQVLEQYKAVQRPLLIPEQVLKQYKAWHGVDVLREESDTALRDRRYSMGYYSCPLQAGNRLHHFMNSLLWAVITNRTLLFQYYDAPTCGYHQEVQTQIYTDPADCQAANPQNECDKVLKRANWVSSYSELANRLQWEANITNAAVTIIDYWKVHSFSRVGEWEQKRFPQLNGTTTDEKVDVLQDILVDFPALVNRDDTLSRPIQREHVLETTVARERTAALFEEGTDFLFGMMFNEAFSFQEMDDQSAVRILQPTGDGNVPFSIAMHSRHRYSRQDGSNTEKEMACFKEILQAIPEHSPCQACLLSDRPKTIQQMTSWLEDTYNCTVVTARHDKADARGSFLEEHGPNAAGFLRELNLCQHASDGIVGSWPGFSSTSLLVELITYNRRTTQRNGTLFGTTSMHRCKL